VHVVVVPPPRPIPPPPRPSWAQHTWLEGSHVEPPQAIPPLLDPEPPLDEDPVSPLLDPEPPLDEDSVPPLDPEPPLEDSVSPPLEPDAPLDDDSVPLLDPEPLPEASGLKPELRSEGSSSSVRDPHPSVSSAVTMPTQAPRGAPLVSTAHVGREGLANRIRYLTVS
jgi:hypothetical protein